MRVLFAVLVSLSLAACGKKVEAVPTPVNPQVTDAVTQVTPPVTTDAGTVSAECSHDFVGPRQPTTVCPQSVFVPPPASPVK